MGTTSRLLPFAAAAAVAAVAAAVAGLAPGPSSPSRLLPPAMAEEPPAKAPAAAPAPSGMVLVKGRKHRIGLDRKELLKLVAETDVGRMSKHIAEAAIEDELSLACPSWSLELPDFWIGKYEVTNAQWHRFLEQACRVPYTVPEEGKPGARTLEEMARMHLVAEVVNTSGGKKHYPVAVDWRGLYDLNVEVLNPLPAGGDPKARPEPETFRSRRLAPGTKLVLYRWTVPGNWKDAKSRLQATPPKGKESHPVSRITLGDALAFASYYGFHVPTEAEWEAATRGPEGEIFPEGKLFDPLGHHWKGFNEALEKGRPAAEKALPGAKKRLEEARSSGNPILLEKATADLARLEWILGAKALPEGLQEPVEVGQFPLGRSPAGAHDLIGNVDEWVATSLFPYPGTDSKSNHIFSTPRILRGGNFMDKDTLLTATFRKFLMDGIQVGTHSAAGTAGFRVARYLAPGASGAFRAVSRALEHQPPVLPRESDPKTFTVVGPGLDMYRAAGIARYDETAGDGNGEPPGKVFWLGRAESLCLVPPTGIPFRDPAALRQAAEKAAWRGAGAEGAPTDTREPRQIPFLGLLHVTDALDVKGTLRTEVRRKVPLKPAERKPFEEALEAWKKRKEQEKKEKEKEKGKEGGDGGDAPPPEKKMADADGNRPAQDKPKNPPKGGDKGGKAPPPPAEGGAEKPPEGDPEEEAEDPDPEPKIPQFKEIVDFAYQPGFLKGARYPDGLLLGFLKVGEGLHGALWEARTGSVGSMAPGGTVLLEAPLLILPEDSVSFKKVARPGSATSSFDTESGEVRLTVYLPVEGKPVDRADWIEATVKLQLGEFPAPTETRPWVAMPGK
jgi:formylglycine-generating enzyme required for sulfatase activity